MTANLYATVIVLGGRGILLRGPARSGKSSLALSCLRRAESHGMPAALVADDQVFADVEDGHVRLRAPEPIRGLIEVSGAGLLRQPFVATATLDLVVDLVERNAIERLPEIPDVELLGCRVRRIAVPREEAAHGADVILSLVLADFALVLPKREPDTIL